jgi:hypothetical protein
MPEREAQKTSSGKYVGAHGVLSSKLLSTLPSAKTGKSFIDMSI